MSGRQEDREFRRQLQRNIDLNFSLHPNQFTRFLEEHADNPSTYQAICHMLADPRAPVQDQLKVATSLNFIAEACFRRNQKNPELWQEYYSLVASNRELSWKIVKAVQKSFKELVESFEIEFQSLVQEVYPSLSFSHKVLLQNIIVFGDIDQRYKISFVGNFFRAYLEEGKNVLLKLLAEAPEQEILHEFSNRMLQFMLSIQQTLQMVTYSTVDEAERLLIKISQDNELMELADICLMLEKDGGRFITEQGSITKKQAENNMKSVSLRIITLVLGTYSKKCALADFDHFRVLGFMESQVPRMCLELKSHTAKELSLQYNSSICMAMLNLIKISSSFVFMSSFFWSSYKELFWRVLYSLLSAGDEENWLFKNEPQSFIKFAECIAEGDADSDTEPYVNPKVSASQLLEELLDNIDGAMTNLTTEIFSILEHCFGSRTELSEGLIREYGIKADLDTILTLLTILATKLRRRQDLAQQLCKIFSRHESEFLSLRNMEQARLIITLSYCSDFLFVEKVPPKQYFEYVADAVGKDEVIMLSALMFFQNCVAEELKETDFKYLSHSHLIWHNLVNAIETTKHLEILQLAAKTLSTKFEVFGHEQLMEVLTHVIRRLHQGRKIMKEGLNEDIWITKCLIMARSIAKRVNIIRQRESKEKFKEVCAELWNVFEFMEHLSSCSFADEVIDVFYFLLDQVEPEDMSQAYYQFLRFFTEYHMSERALGKLFDVYLLLLNKGQIIERSPQGQQFLQFIVDNVLLVVRRGSGGEAIEALCLLQFIVHQFSNRLNHQPLYQATRPLFDTVVDDEKDHRARMQKIAAILNLWVMGSVSSPVYSLAQFADIDISIFRGQHADVLVLALCTKVQSLVESSGNINEIVYLCKKCIQVLKNICSTNEEQETNPPNIPLFKDLNPFATFKKTLHQANNRLTREEFASIYTEISREQLLSLVNRVKVNNQQRVIFKIK